MDEFFERFAIRAATIDELLSDAYAVSPGQKADADVAARRLSAWCRSCAGGDWTLFSRRLARDGLTFEQVLARLSTVRVPRGLASAASSIGRSSAVIDGTRARGLQSFSACRWC